MRGMCLLEACVYWRQGVYWLAVYGVAVYWLAVYLLRV